MIFVFAGREIHSSRRGKRTATRRFVILVAGTMSNRGRRIVSTEFFTMRKIESTVNVAFAFVRCTFQPAEGDQQTRWTNKRERQMSEIVVARSEVVWKLIFDLHLHPLTRRQGEKPNIAADTCLRGSTNDQNAFVVQGELRMS